MLPSKAELVDAKLHQCHNSHLQNKYSIQFQKSQEQIYLFFKFFSIGKCLEANDAFKTKKQENYSCFC